MKKSLLVLFLVFLMSGMTASAATWYIDSRTGSDANDGQSPKTAWKSLFKVNATLFQPGDRVLFARGGLWRGTLIPHSGIQGKPICYGAYGEGPLPKFYGSVDASSPDDWIEVQPGLWATQKIEPIPGKLFNQKEINGVMVQGDNRWAIHTEQGAKANVTTSGSGFKLKCTQGGTASNHIQLWGPLVTGKLPECGIILHFRARCSKEYAMPLFAIQTASNPWNHWFSMGGTVQLNPQWQEVTVFLPRQAMGKEPDKKEMIRYHLSLGNMPSDSVLEAELIKVQEASLRLDKLLSSDVGNIIFNHGDYKKLHRCGIKKWKKEDCKAPGDYWYNAEDRRVYLRFDGNPGNELDSIELALRRHVIDENARHDVTYENLAVAYGAAHGFGGGSTERIIIRNCDIYYIGGGHQFTRPDGHPVRFGNGIEFWGNCKDNLVENCRLWEVYDAALTNQGRDDSEINITYRGNIIWNSEYSFEYWNAKTTENILFENNICLDAGFGWAHDQRPDPNGGHLMFYQNKAQTKNFVVRNNVFHESTEVCIRMENDWRSGLTLEGNQYYQSEKPLIRWKGKTYYGKDELKRACKELGIEKTGTIKPFARHDELIKP